MSKEALKNKNLYLIFIIILFFLFSTSYYFFYKKSEVQTAVNSIKPKVKNEAVEPELHSNRSVASFTQPSSDELVADVESRDEKIAVEGEDEKIAVEGEDEKIAVEGEDEKIAVEGEGEKIAVEGEDEKIAAENSLVLEVSSPIALGNKQIEGNNHVELISPKLITSEAFYCEHNRRKVPVKLEWEPVEEATSYKVTVHRQYKDKKTYLHTVRNKMHIMIYPNARYKWQILAFKNKELITKTSAERNLYVKAPVGEETVSKYEKNYPQFNGEYEKVNHHYELNLNYVLAKPIKEQMEEEISKELISRKVASVQANNYTLWSRFWLNAGAGLNLTSYEQEILGTATLAYDAVNSPNFKGEVGFFVTDKSAFVASGFVSPGNLTEEEKNLNEDYTWTSYSLEGIYLLGDGKVSNKVKSNWYLRYGIHQHELPLLEAFPSSADVFILDNTLINFGLGIGNRTKFSNDLRTDIYLRYQHPLSSKANRNTYSLDNGRLIDFYIAANYQLHRNFHMGAFLNSQYLNLEYSLDNGLESVQGNQSLFNNIFGLYLGFEL